MEKEPPYGSGVAESRVRAAAFGHAASAYGDGRDFLEPG